MIITVTLNPAVDLTAEVHDTRVGYINRYRDPLLDPAGKGINASRMAHRLGWPTIAFGLLAGEIGAIVDRTLNAEGVPAHFVNVSGQTRLNFMVVDPVSHETTGFYGPGPNVDADHLSRLNTVLEFWLPASRVLVLAGSLPPGVPTDIYAQYIRVAHNVGIKTILDADGEPLRLGVEAHPYLIKPNVTEAEALLGHPLPSLAAIVQGARQLVRRGTDVVVISMGSEGAICAYGDEVWHIVPPKVERQSTVGSGDSLVAGLAVAIARGNDIVTGLRLGTAAGAATAMTPGTTLGSRVEVERLVPQVKIERVPIGRSR